MNTLRQVTTQTVGEGRFSISVVIITANRKEVVLSVVEALLRDETPNEIVVVVDRSDDGTLEALESRAQGESRLRAVHVGNEGRGEAKARQIGAEAASSDIVLFLDDDVLPEPELVAGHRRHHIDTDDAVVVGYMPVRFDGPRQPEDLGKYLYSDAYERRCAEYAANAGTILRGLWAGNISLRRHRALQIGFASDGFEGFAVDRDFGLRCLEAGLRGVFDPSLRARHLYDRDLRSFLSNVYQQGKGRWFIHQRHSELVGFLDPHAFDNDLPQPAAFLVRACRRERSREMVTGSLSGLAYATGKLHLYGAQTKIGRLLRRIEYQRGVLDAAVAAGNGR
jgi:glycosyltransferase involved in cell wall biosynthesis